jgi:hypothetical protein
VQGVGEKLKILEEVEKFFLLPLLTLPLKYLFHYHWLVSTGGPIGVTSFEGSDATLVPASFIAKTLKLYVIPFIRPVTVIGLEDPVALIVATPGFEITKYEVTELPPSDSGAAKLTVASPSPADAKTLVGALGTVEAEKPED